MSWIKVELKMPVPIEEWQADSTDPSLLKDSKNRIWVGFRIKDEDGEVSDKFWTNHPTVGELYPIGATITHWKPLADSRLIEVLEKAKQELKLFDRVQDEPEPNPLIAEIEDVLGEKDGK